MAVCGRACPGTIRTPQLVRSYLLGEATGFPGDTDEERSARKEQGDYIARMHQRVKGYIRETRPRYQYPRRHSFQALVSNIMRVGLLEETVVPEAGAEQPEYRGAGVLGTEKGFNVRTWVRVVPGKENDPLWNFPVRMSESTKLGTGAGKGPPAKLPVVGAPKGGGVRLTPAPTPAVEEGLPAVTQTDLDAIGNAWASVSDRISGWKAPHSANATKFIDRFVGEMTSEFPTIEKDLELALEAVRAALKAYQEIDLDDYEGDAEVYSEARADAWKEFVDSLDIDFADTIEVSKPEEGPAIEVIPPVPAAPKRARKPRAAKPKPPAEAPKPQPTPVTVVGIPVDVYAALEEERTKLAALLEEASREFDQPGAFEALSEGIQNLMWKLRPYYAASPYLDLFTEWPDKEGALLMGGLVETFQKCHGELEQNPLGSARHEAALRSCRAVAKLLSEALVSIPEPSTVTGAARPRTGGHHAVAEPVVENTPELPAFDVGPSPTPESRNALQEYLQSVADLPLSEVSGRQLGVIAEAVAAWRDQATRLSDSATSQRRATRLQALAEALDRAVEALAAQDIATAVAEMESAKDI